MQESLFSIPLNLLLWSVCAVLFIFFNVFSAVLLWHWRTYSTGRFTTIANMTLYLGVGFTLVGIMAFVALTVSLT